jgi:cell division transport system permease protein
MTSQEEKFNRRRLRSAYVSVTISIALVLFLIGMLGFLALNAGNLAREVRENFTFTLYLKSDAPELDVRALQKDLMLKDYVKNVEYISKEEAAEVWQKELGEDFLEFLDGYNPLSDHIDIRLKSDFVETEKIDEIKAELGSLAIVNEIHFDPNLIQLVNENLRKIGIFLLGGALLLMLVSIALINSSIRLNIYSRRFLIKTMQLVGATRTFIQKPFLTASLRLGIIGSVVALVLLILVGMAVLKYFPDLQVIFQPIQLLWIFLVMLFFGVAISLASTWLAVNKFLNIKTDEIYY